MSLADELITELTTEFHNDDDFDADILTVKVNQAIRKVKMRRNYFVTSMTEEEIEADLYSYYAVIFQLAEFYYNQRGGEYETQHSEDGVNRSWISEEDLLQSVYAYVKVL